jgi:DNA-binding transcriptional LysR family regulator
VLTSFARRYPKVGVQIFDGNHDYVIGHVRAGLAELGISMDPGDDEDVSFEPLLTDRFVLAAAADGQLAKLSTVSLETLRSERLIIGGRDSGNRLLLELQLGKEISGLRWFYEVEHISSVLALVRRGIGCAVVPSLSISANQTPNVVGIPIEGSSITRRVGVVSHKTISISPMAADFRELLMATVNKRF